MTRTLTVFSMAANICRGLGLDWAFTGSRVICDPAPTDTDLDVVAYADTEERFNEIVAGLAKSGWVEGGSQLMQAEGGDRWTSLKRDDENIILTWERAFFECFVMATAWATQMNLTWKPDRVDFFTTCFEVFPGLVDWRIRKNKVQFTNISFSDLDEL